MDIVRKIVEILSPKLNASDRAYLFGSRARGESRQDSDWDILIILDKDRVKTSDYDEITFPLTSLGWNINQVISPIMYTREEWEKQRFTPFFKNVQRDAILLI